MNKLRYVQLTALLVFLLILVNGAALAYQGSYYSSTTASLTSATGSKTDNISTLHISSKSIRILSPSKSRSNFPCCTQSYCKHLNGHCGICFAAACVDTLTLFLNHSSLAASDKLFLKPRPIYISPPTKPPELL